MDPLYTIEQIAEAAQVSVNKVYGWVHNGHLSAVNVSSKRSGRPCLRVRKSDWEAFQDERLVGRPAQPRRAASSNIPNYV